MSVSPKVEFRMPAALGESLFYGLEPEGIFSRKTRGDRTKLFAHFDAIRITPIVRASFVTLKVELLKGAEVVFYLDPISVASSDTLTVHTVKGKRRVWRAK